MEAYVLSCELITKLHKYVIQSMKMKIEKVCKNIFSFVMLLFVKIAISKYEYIFGTDCIWLYWEKKMCFSVADIYKIYYMFSFNTLQHVFLQEK